MRKLSEARHKADELLPSSEKRAALILPLARVFAVCAAGESEIAVRSGDLSHAKTLVESLTALSYRDSFGLATDPDLAILKSESWFQVLVDQKQLSSK